MYQLIKMKRKTISISILMSGEVVVKVPKYMTNREVEKWMKEKSDWIEKKQQEIQKKQEKIQEKSYMDGDVFSCMGEDYTLRIIINQNRRRVLVKTEGNILFVELSVWDREVVKQTIATWYKKRAKEEIPKRVAYFNKQLQEEVGSIRVKEQKSRFGSCSSKRNLNFNWHLLMAPPKVMDYVVVHELCHLKHMNHGKEFWLCVEQMLPDYKKFQKWLKDYGYCMKLSILAVLMMSLTVGCSMKSTQSAQMPSMQEVEQQQEANADTLPKQEQQQEANAESVPIQEEQQAIDAKTEEDRLHVENIELELPGASREYQFLFISDTHVVTMNEADDQEVYEYALSRKDAFLDANGIPSKETFPAWIAYANKQNPDALFLGGDIIDHPSDTNVETLRENLGNLQLPYLYTLGNHDWTYPWEYGTEKGEENYRPLFDEFMNGNTAVQTMEFEDMTILAVDNSLDQMNKDAIEVIEDTLEKEKPVILIMHVPLETETLIQKTTKIWGRSIAIGENGIYPQERTKEVIDMIYAENSPVVAILTGHVHFSNRDKLDKNITQIVTDAGYKGEGVMLYIKPMS